MLEYISVVLLAVSLLALIVGGISIRLVLNYDEENREPENKNIYM